MIGSGNERSLWSRHEMKYLISESTAAAVTQYIKAYTHLDRHSEFKPNNAYMISSVYMDSPELRLCRESLDGQKNRFKLRIRTYTDDPDYPRYFEIKRRVTTIIVKSRARVMYHSVKPLLAGELISLPDHDIESENLRQFLLYMHSINAKPVVGIRYMRQAFEGVIDDRVRITFDRELSYNTNDNPLLKTTDPGWYLVPLSNKVILEIKFTGTYPAWLDRMVKYFGLKSQSVSKYANSIRQSCLLRFCAPHVPLSLWE
ncbi:MAG: polyphosphate polymerase domain-containing protein [Sedimentisphaerales bacterium]|nr:polyphosphate polymerase domain-containing protein [Sedimentisphaerales bacterium]